MTCSNCYELEHEKLLVTQLQSQSQSLFDMWQKEIALADMLATHLQSTIPHVNETTRYAVIAALNEWKKLRI